MSGSASTPAVRPEDVAPIHDVALRLARRLRKRSGSTLTMSQLSALSTLERNGQMSVGDLARREHVGRSSVTRVVATLEREGYLDRTTDPQDRRSHLVSVSRQGHTLLAEARDRANAFLASEVDRLDPYDRAALLAAIPALEHLVALPQKAVASGE